MHQFKIVKILFFLAVLFFVAKPFLGFCMFSRLNPPSTVSIFVKAFTKRKQEYVKDSKFDIQTIQQKLADPANQLLLGFAFLLSILFPLISSDRVTIGNRYLQRLKFSLSSSPDTWLLNSQFLI
ncbi:hypothetical protein [Mucilaginibacter gotjawali]|uniref:Uncharacterized protein n=2 Tax=Mucilaginibacter gotjawali TaxID=1550579 RepID=A0A0X8X3Q7_9SPHI|nr:hypothetical protein [Mucilaginibacter gotjawali]MBB3055766.1 hypothetical protein [Mucilaginibacter gotjawali]BAU54587.1 hypothetical protein MgSA37_02763 [Mucilaginibacter gotjawali]